MKIPRKTGLAKALRKKPTYTETRLWARLRLKRFHGLTFRRQATIGPYIVDFYCPAHKVVVEIDGATHPFRLAYDKERQEWLEGQGLTVVRFSNPAIDEDLGSSLHRLGLACGLPVAGI